MFWKKFFAGLAVSMVFMLAVLPMSLLLVAFILLIMYNEWFGLLGIILCPILFAYGLVLSEDWFFEKLKNLYEKIDRKCNKNGQN